MAINTVHMQDKLHSILSIVPMKDPTTIQYFIARRKLVAARKRTICILGVLLSFILDCWSWNQGMCSSSGFEHMPGNIAVKQAPRTAGLVAAD